MAAKVFARCLFGSENLKNIEKDILRFIASKNDGVVDEDYLESVDILVAHVLEINKDANIAGTESTTIKILDTTLNDICLPLLHTPRPSAYDENKASKMNLLQATCKLLSKIAHEGPLETSQQIWLLLLRSLRNFVEECKRGFGEGYEVGSSNDVLGAATALDVLGSLLEGVHSWEEERKKFRDKENQQSYIDHCVLNAVLDVLTVVRNGTLLFKITGKILPRLLAIDERRSFQNSKAIWDTVKILLLQEEHESKDCSSAFYGSYAIMSSLADLYFISNSKSVFKVHHDPVFWKMLHKGLVNIDPLVRKRSLYLLQKAVQMSKDSGEKEVVDESCPVFWWNSQHADALFKVWHQYIFLFEILEEKQLHVIRPVLPRLGDLIDATKRTNEFEFPLLHVSWLTVLVHRGAIHENRFIKKWAITCFMTLDLEKVPLLEYAVTRCFTSETLVMLLKEPTLYAKSDGESKNEPSRLSKELTGFFKKCFDALDDDDQKVEFVHRILSSIYQYNISHVPLTFMCQGLANISRSPLFDVKLLTSVQRILSNVTSHSVVLRGAVQTFLLRTVMHFLNPKSVRLDDVFVFLGIFVKEESLGKGISLWREVGEWLSLNVNDCQRSSKDLFTFLYGKVQEFLADSVSGKNLAKFILLCCDCSVITAGETDELLNSIFLCISKAHSNPYFPVSKCWQAVELLRALFHEIIPMVSSQSVTDGMLIALACRLNDVLPSLMHCLLRAVEQDNECSSFLAYRLCVEMLDEVKSLWSVQKFPDNVSCKYQNVISSLANIGRRFLVGEAVTFAMNTKAGLRFIVAGRWMIWVLEFADISGLQLATEYRNDFLKCIRSLNLVNHLDFRNSTSKLSNSDCYLNLRNSSARKQDCCRILVEELIVVLWKCVNMAEKDKPCESEECSTEVDSCTLAGSPISKIVNACSESLSLVSGPSCLPCLETLQLFLPKLVSANDESACVRLVQTAWDVLNEIRARYRACFWLALGIVVKIVFAPELLLLPAGHPLSSLVADYWASFLAIAHDQSGLVSVAVSHMCKVFGGGYKALPREVCMESLKTHVEIIADISLFGPVHKKDLKLLVDTLAYVKNMGQDCGVVCLAKQKEFECEFTRVRVDIVKFFLNLDPAASNVKSFITLLIKVLLARNKSLSDAKTSRFLNSENHRQKQRLWQIIAVLVCMIDMKAFALELMREVMQGLESDNQTSVRFLMEWTLVRLFATHMKHLELLWQQLKNVSKKRLGYVASLVTIATHIFLAIDEPKMRRDCLFHLLPAIIPCAFLNHSLIRAYILDALRLICEVCSGEVWTLVTEQFPVVDSCLAFSDAVVEGEKEKGRLVKDRVLFSLHPVHDYTIEVLFETAPSIAGVVKEEIVSPWSFQNEGTLPWVHVKRIPLLRESTSSTTLSKKGKLDVRGGSPGNTTVTEKDAKSFGEADVQKKITPWQVTAPPKDDIDLFDQLQQRPIQRRVGDLVVVASLIDRAPNLGGLCRTCEIFGASKLVLGSKHVMSEIGFKSVSVSSEKWVDVGEVKVNDLMNYLTEMKEEGFTIVGVEQTAHSKKLTDFHFPCDTVLVLGNEKSGIPADLIQVLDECVEIPQHGIIRSLNVHVSGALFIWEYSRQHLNDH